MTFRGDTALVFTPRRPRLQLRGRFISPPTRVLNDNTNRKVASPIELATISPGIGNTASRFAVGGRTRDHPPEIHHGAPDADAPSSPKESSLNIRVTWMEASGNSRRNCHAPLNRQPPPPGWPKGQPGGLFFYLLKTISAQGDMAPPWTWHRRRRKDTKT